MSFDKSRYTFNPRNDYSGVVMQQGRVQMDSDWNEWLAELVRRMQAGTLDIMGRAVYPATTPHAFELTFSGSGNLLIGPGRMYLDGLLVENHGDPDDNAAAQWDPALGEMSDAPQPPFVSAATGAIDYTKQPYMPAGTTLPTSGSYLAYLDVWVRPVDYINDPSLIDPGVGVDTTGRLQTVWQVQLLSLSDKPGITCGSPITDWAPAPSAGLLTTGTTPTAPSGPCCLTSGSAYTGLENQFYRVEIHQPGTPEASATPPTGPATGATFKWSRDNGSVITAVISITTVSNSTGSVSQLTVQSLGRDQVLGFRPGDWIEILDDTTEFGQQPGELHQIDTIDVAAKTINLATLLGAGFPTGDTDPLLHTRIRRWDQAGKVYEEDGATIWWDIDAQGSAEIPVPPAGTTLILENGITVSFDVRLAGGAFDTGDFWTFAARTATGKVEELSSVTPRGIHHHYAALAMVTFPGSAKDCRTPWPPGGEECGCCCTYTVGDGVNTFGKYTSINAAINALPPDSGGEVCILPGRYFENVFIDGRKDVVLRGCGWQTRIASASLNPTPLAFTDRLALSEAPASASASTTGSTFNAVITVSGSQHVQLLSFAVEAAEDEVGVLIDGTGKLSPPPPTSPPPDTGSGNIEVVRSRIIKAGPTQDVTAKDLVITAAKLPAILADSVTLLQIEDNRVAMANVPSSWPAVRVSGNEIRIVHNWLGTLSKANEREWLPATVQADIVSQLDQEKIRAGGNPGGIQIAGPLMGTETTDVFVIENEIDSAGRNGITLGSLTILDAKGKNTGEITGTTVEVMGPCDKEITFVIPTTKTGQTGSRIVAAGKLVNIQIARNRIRNTRACGIGPIGFFDPKAGAEIVIVENLTITGNTISSTLLQEVSVLTELESGAFGAISLPYVENLVIRDNAITDFGNVPGAPVCGIFVFVGQMIDISRNQVLETRDWNLTEQSEVQAGPVRGGIVTVFATPPSFANNAALYKQDTLAAEYLAPSFVPGVPALRVEHNVVRVASGEALEAAGFGPFSIVNNHLSTAGTLGAGITKLAQTVCILNLGLDIEATSLAGNYTGLGTHQIAGSKEGLKRSPATISNGAVTFANNICQLEARFTNPKFFSSVLILSLDDLIFSNNQCWVDAVPLSGALDAFLLASFIQVTGNRFQEAALFPILASGYTAGALNVTAQNISTYCLFCTGILQPALDANNLSLINSFFAVTDKKSFCDIEAANLPLRFKKS